MPPADRPGDAGREAVYAAELAAWDGTDLERVVGVDHLRSVAAGIFAGAWWPGPAIDVRAARADGLSSTTRCVTGTEGAVAVVRIAATQATIATLAHELAHALAGADAGHGPRFRRALLDVVLVATNLRSVDRRRTLHHDQLATAFAAFGLPVGGRSWPAPPAELSGPIAL